MAPFSVLMSIYIKEKPEYVDECFKSLLQQTLTADEWVVVEDGPLSNEMYRLLDDYQLKYPGLIKRIIIKKNKGLGNALRVGILKCKNSIIARMDTDDIARSDRFEKQFALFKKNPQLDICGSNIDEFEGDKTNIVAKRRVPSKHCDIIRYQKKRDAFNHMTVMYRKKAVLKAGNYIPCPLMEDTYLWARMMMNGARCANINESLVYARIGEAMYERRGGWEYFKKYKSGREKVFNTGFISRYEYLYTISIQFLVAMVPSNVRGYIFKKILHR